MAGANTWMWRRVLASALLTILPGCSADQAPAPEPTLFTPGAIFAHQRPEGGYSLSQMLSEFHLTATESVFFVKVFANTSSSVEEARRLCMDGALTLDVPALAVSRGSLEGSEVVWFLTLTEEDLAATR